jgi:uncharacterized protein YbbC (DUF1343 family)
VIWEGTNLSEGRGTCRPFEIFGAPYLEPGPVKDALDSDAIQGCHIQEVTFRPTFNKWQGRLCRGFMIHILDHEAYSPYAASLAFLKAVMDVHGSRFAWKEPPYEYEHKKKPIDLIVGDSSVRLDLESGTALSVIVDGWRPELSSYEKWRRPYLIYR